MHKGWVQIIERDSREWRIPEPAQVDTGGGSWRYAHQDLAVAVREDGTLVYAVRLFSETHKLMAWWREFGHEARQATPTNSR